MGLDWDLVAGFTRHAVAEAITASLRRLAENDDVLNYVAGYMSREELGKAWPSLPLEERQKWKLLAGNALRGLRLYLRKRE